MLTCYKHYRTICLHNLVLFHPQSLLPSEQTASEIIFKKTFLISVHLEITEKYDISDTVN